MYVVGSDSWKYGLESGKASVTLGPPTTAPTNLFGFGFGLRKYREPALQPMWAG